MNVKLFAPPRSLTPHCLWQNRFQGEFRPAGGIIGTWAEELKWPRAVRPGDELEVVAEVLEVRPSGKRPGVGYVKCRTTTVNQNGEPVQVLVMNLLVQRKNASPRTIG